MSDPTIGEISTVIRALKSALDKSANQIYKTIHGVPSRSTYFPLTTNSSQFESLLEKNIPGIRELSPTVADAIQSCQPFVPEFACLGALPCLYRKNMHHGFELHVMRETVELQDIHDETKSDQREWASNEDSWSGITTERKTWICLTHDYYDVDVKCRHDWYFEGNRHSVMGTLLGMHNATVKAIGLIGSSIGAPLSPADSASMSIRLGYR
ncbi:hypothetical protein [Changpingibacter yushuensis]|uniref:hypothetical protein n=1 Tax=Changpingibacter yushuensis TaxID=2758440 RepID=UPI00165E4279|nr:hypothetical protein [Changpingibacter yushuensis]